MIAPSLSLYMTAVSEAVARWESAHGKDVLDYSRIEVGRKTGCATITITVIGYDDYHYITRTIPHVEAVTFVGGLRGVVRLHVDAALDDLLAIVRASYERANV